MDACEILADPSLDCDGDDQIDACQIAADPSLDCNRDGRLDACFDIIVYVDDDAPPGGNGWTWATAFTHLQDALDAVRNSPTCPIGRIWVAQGTYYPDRNAQNPTGTGQRLSTFQLIDGVAIYGGFAGAYAGLADPDERKPSVYQSILSGDLDNDDGPNFVNRSDNSYNVVYANSTTSPSTILDGFVITGGSAVGGPELRANMGGGLALELGTATVNGCVFFANQAGANCGGAVCNYSSPTLPPLVLTNCLFFGNRTTTNGGAVASRLGSGAYGAGVKLVNCTLSGNEAAQKGGGMYVQDENSQGTGSSLINCVLWGNTAPQGGGHELAVFASNPVKVTVHYSNLQGGSTDVFKSVYANLDWANNINSDPVFAAQPPSMLHDYRLTRTSPCINAGDPAFVPAPGETDLFGGPRVVHYRVDMGAHEFMCLSPSDFDGDYDVDLVDFAIFQDCFNGPNRAPQEGCPNLNTDLDHDNDVDLADFLVFQASFAGPNRPPKQDCDGGGAGLQGEGMFASRDLLEGDGLDSFEVTFDLQSPQAGQTISAGTPVEWRAAVGVTGESQGLGGYVFSLFLGPGTGPTPGPDGIWGNGDDQNLASIELATAQWPETFAVPGPNGKPTSGAALYATGPYGGPGMDRATSVGYNEKPGTLLQVGNGHLSWTPWRYRSSPPPLAGWTGDHTWGVGLDGRKATLLLDTEGDYEVNAGEIDTTNLSAGHYVLTLVPSSAATVLDPAVDLSVSQPGGLMLYAESVSGPVSIEFDIGEE